MNLSVWEKLDRYIEEHRKQQVEDICRLVRVDSSRTDPLPGMPFGRGAADALAQALLIAENKGFLVNCIDDCVGIVEMEAAEDGVDILSHLDVVPAGDNWTVTQPFSPVVSGNRIYGRGAADNKGPSMGVLYALEAVRSLGIPFKRRVRILWGTAEETGSEDLRQYYKSQPPAPMTVSPDASFPVITTEKGRFEGHLKASYAGGTVKMVECIGPSNAVPAVAKALLTELYEPEYKWIDGKTENVRYEWNKTENGTEITVYGKAAHAAAPQNGENALTALLSVLAKIPGTQMVLKELTKAFPHGDYYAAALDIKQSDVVSAPLTVCLSSMIWNEDHGLEAVFDCRLPVGATEQSAVWPVKRRMEQVGIGVEGEFIPPHMVPEDSPFVQTLLECWKECTNEEARSRAIAGNTYAHGIPGAVAFGFADPVIRTGTHGPDEYIDINQLMLGTRIYARMIYKLCL